MKTIKKNKVSSDQLKVREAMPLECKINLSLQRIKSFYEHFNGDVYVAFSGGKDSTVLLNLVREYYPHVPAVFVNTGLEYLEIIKFVKTIENVIWLRPEMNFKAVLEKYGYPIISKMQATYINSYRNTNSDKEKKLRWNGKIYNGVLNYKISEKWKFLINAPFKISAKCCEIMKKRPMRKYNKESNRKAIIGIMASDSIDRKKQYLQDGCNAFDMKNPQSRPIMFWMENDIWEYIEIKKISYSEIYNMGQKTTGCIFCGFGAHLNQPNRFQKMKLSHPKLYNYCIEKLGFGEVLDYIGVDY